MSCNYLVIKLNTEEEHAVVSDSEEQLRNLRLLSIWSGSKQADQPSAVENTQPCLTEPKCNT